RQDALVPGHAELLAAAIGLERHVGDIVVDAALARRAGAGIERILMRRAVEQRGVRLDYGLRALAVVDIEIEDGDAARAVLGLRMARADRHAVEQAEAARRVGRGMMAGRPHRREG